MSNFAAKMDKGLPEGKRHDSDFYPTPPEPTIALIKALHLPESTVIWEPAAGEGDMSECLKGMGYSVIASDINENADYGIEKLDFLTEVADEPYDWIITNPPFIMAEQFIRRAWDIGKPFAFLLKVQYYNATKRYPLFCECRPSLILPLAWRVNFLFKGRRHSSPPMDMMWVVWYPNDKRLPEYCPLLKPEVGNDDLQESTQ